MLVKCLRTGKEYNAMQYLWNGVYDCYRGTDMPASTKASVGFINKGCWLVQHDTQIMGPFDNLQFKNKYKIISESAIIEPPKQRKVKVNNVPELPQELIKNEDLNEQESALPA